MRPVPSLPRLRLPLVGAIGSLGMFRPLLSYPHETVVVSEQSVTRPVFALTQPSFTARGNLST